MTSKNKHGHKKSHHSQYRNEKYPNEMKVYRGRIATTYPERDITPNASTDKNSSAIKSERGNSAPSKSEVIHANGKTRPVRGDKGHFIGSESIHSGGVKAPVSKRGGFKVRSNDTASVKGASVPQRAIPDQTSAFLYSTRVHKSSNNIKNDPGKSIKQDPSKVKIFRVYSENELGYRYEISQDPPANKTHVEIVMVLYDPMVDIIALDRAIKKYRMYPK